MSSKSCDCLTFRVCKYLLLTFLLYTPHKSVRNRCVIVLFVALFVLSLCPFWHFCWCRGFCHRIESDLFLFLFLPILTFLPNLRGFHRTLQRVRLANRGRLLLQTPGPVPFGTCICSNVETILSWTCHVYRPFEFRTSLGTSIFLIVIKYR